MRFATEDGVSLEGEIRRPDAAPWATAVLCHAHPRHGGSKDHPILWAVRNELAARGLVVLGFNFRGTMRSGGTHGGGHTEVRDVAAAIGRVRDEAPGPTLVAGWSFGASVALREALEDERVSALALIGLPLEPRGFELAPLPGTSELRLLRRPVLLVAGETDEHCPEPELRELASALPNAQVAIVSSTDHHLWRREAQTARIVGDLAERWLA